MTVPEPLSAEMWAAVGGAPLVIHPVLHAKAGEANIETRERPSARSVGENQYGHVADSQNVLTSLTLEKDAWPESPGSQVYAGLSGELVRLADIHTEADPVAILGSFLTAFGCALGPGPHAMVGATRHDPRIFLVLVGKSGKARKGESWSPVRTLLELADPQWASKRILSGLSSGEGLINAVRDKQEKQVPIRGEPGRFETQLVDEGVEDKRLLVVEPEFARVLSVMTRQGNTLNAVLRDAWDRGNLHVMTKTPIHATAAHICLIAHITTEELRRELRETDSANGFANRFMWLAVRRSKLLPIPEPFQSMQVEKLGQELATLLEWARGVGRMQLDPSASDLWKAAYEDLSVERAGLAGAILGRSEPQVLRLALLYALLDGSDTVHTQHLVSAIELWAYSERSAYYVFGDSTGDYVADTIYQALRQSKHLTRTQISGLFDRNVKADRIALALLGLEGSNKARKDTEIRGEGRPSEVWSLVT